MGQLEDFFPLRCVPDVSGSIRVQQVGIAWQQRARSPSSLCLLAANKTSVKLHTITPPYYRLDLPAIVSADIC